MSGFGDFDFLIGEWTITNEFLKGRLVGSADWETFPATSKVEKVMPIADGAFAGGHGGNLDTMFVPSRGFTGMTLRLFDPQADQWSIYWSDTKSFRLFPPTIGRFENGRGEFFGDDLEGACRCACASIGRRARARSGSSPFPPMVARTGKRTGSCGSRDHSLRKADPLCSKFRLAAECLRATSDA